MAVAVQAQGLNACDFIRSGITDAAQLADFESSQLKFILSTWAYSPYMSLEGWVKGTRDQSVGTQDDALRLVSGIRLPYPDEMDRCAKCGSCDSQALYIMYTSLDEDYDDYGNGDEDENEDEIDKRIQGLVTTKAGKTVRLVETPCCKKLFCTTCLADALYCSDGACPKCQVKIIDNLTRAIPPAVTQLMALLDAYGL